MRFAPGALILVLAGAAFAEDAPSVLVRFGAADDPDRPDSLRAVAVSADGRFVALVGEPESPTDDLAVLLRDAATGQLVHRLSGHEGPVRSIAFSPRGDRLATVTADSDGFGVVRLFDVKTGMRARTIEAGGRIVRFLPDGRLAVAGFGRVLVFDSASGREVRRFPAMPVVKDVSADGRFALGVSHHGRGVLEVRDLAAGKPAVLLAGCATEPLAAVFSPDAQTVAAADPRTRTVIAWELLTGQEVHRLDPQMTVASLAFTPDGRHLFAGGFGESIRAWEVATGSPTGRLTGHDGGVLALAAAPGDRLLSGATDRTAILWSLASVRGSTLPSGPLATTEIDAAWGSLAGAGPAAAYRSLGLIASRPGDLLPAIIAHVERQLVPVPDADLARLLAELDHADYRVRERATAALMTAGDSVRLHLERALAETASPEVRSRLRLALRRSGLTPRFSPGDLLRLRRLIGCAGSFPERDAERLLRLVADEFPDPAVAIEARDALRRIEVE